MKNCFVTVFAPLAISASLFGCTTVRIDSGPDNVRIERHFGALFVSVNNVNEAYSAQVSSIGISNTPMGFAVGYSNQSWVNMPKEHCRMVLWINSQTEFAEAKKLAQKIDKLCIAPPQSSEKE